MLACRNDVQQLSADVSPIGQHLHALDNPVNDKKTTTR